MAGKTFREWLGQEMERQGVSRRELARRLAEGQPGDPRDVAESQRRSVRRILNGETNPTPRTRTSICKALGIDPSEAPSSDDEEDSLAATLQAMAREHAEHGRKLRSALKAIRNGAQA